MNCFRPLTLYRAPGGAVSASPVEGYRDLPFQVRCGQCRACRIDRTRAWACRLVHHNSLHEESCFVTLTYGPSSLPKDASLDVTHFQGFMKRLRQKVRREDKKAKRELRKLSYFHCGEYGEQNHRPHYHALIFGWSPDDLEYFSGKEPSATYTSETLDKLWNKGFTTAGSVTYQSAAYVASYIQKKVTGNAARHAYIRTLVDPDTGECTVVEVKPEYATMSRRPGIGAAWLSRFSSDVYPHDDVVIEGRHYRPPKYYDDQVEEKDPAFMEAIKAKRRSKVDTKNSTPDRLKTREQLAELRALAVDRKL